MIKGEYTDFMIIIWNHSCERFMHAISNISVMGTFRFFSIASEGVVIILTEEDGKLSLTNRVFTGYFTIVVEWIVIILQWIFECWPSNWWLRGNIFAICDHMFAGIQFILSIFLLLDF